MRQGKRHRGKGQNPYAFPEESQKLRLPEEVKNWRLRGMTAPKLRRYALYLTSDLLQRMQLVRALTGIPLREWTRWMLTMAVDLELARRPGTLFLRPGSRIYRLEGHPDPVPVPIAMSLGGERVWALETIPDLRLGQQDPTIDPELSGSGILCDITNSESTHEGYADYRRVVVAVADCLPREPMPWTSGLFSLRNIKQREEVRRRFEKKRPLGPASAGL